MSPIAWSVSLSVAAAFAALPISLPAGINWGLVLIPPITGIIGYITNWVGIRLLFYPVEFRGFDVPRMEQVTQLLPEKIQQIPGMREGRLGWQGIIPSRAGKMGSVAVDDGIAKLATQREFYQHFDPHRIAEHVVASIRTDVHERVEEIIREEHPQLWQDLPAPVRRTLHARLDAKLPQAIETIATEIGENIDDLLDIKLMVINHLEQNRQLLNNMFLEVGDRELKFLVNSGFYLGTFLGIFSIPLFVYIDKWWVLPIAGVFVGYFTNFIAIKAIFNPINEYTVGPFRIQGLFIKRQDEASEKYAQLVASEVITIGNVARNLLHGSQSDRTHRMIQHALRPAVDDAIGVAQPLVRITGGADKYERIREAIATDGVEYTLEPLQDETFNEERSVAIERLIAERMKKLPPEEFVPMLRNGFREDEWLLIMVGAALGFVAGWIQLLVVTAV
ncbi:MAG: DUF445 domain-containing protein [Halorientalis sp.]